jgi:hypothetical protein
MTNATTPIKQPHPYTVSKGPVEFKFALIDPANEVWLFTANGVPVAGTSGTGAGWAGPGSLCIGLDVGNSVKLYINTNTRLSPTWTVVGSQT